MPDERTNLRPSPADDERPDEELAARLVARDVAALEALYGRHARPMYSLAMKLLSEPAQAEEVVQECFLKLWRQPALFRAERGRLITWLLGMTHNRAVDQLRRRRVERRYSSDEEIDPPAGQEADPESQVWGRFQAETLGRALADLPPNQRLALELAYLRGMTQVEIAAALGEPLGTIKTRMRLAMHKLRAVPELVALAGEQG